MRNIKTLCGVGINDADYKTSRHGLVNGVSKRLWVCPIYKTWVNMINRCYNERMVSMNPTYADCSVSDEWLRFSAFKCWMETQDWLGMELDKDILIPGNRIYSSETCVFVDPALNLFLVDRSAARGKWPLGVCWSGQAKKFMARCRNPFTGKADYLGLFNCPDQAHSAWKTRKHELSLIYAEIQAEPRVAEALRKRFANQ